MNVPRELRYTKTHEWVKLDGNIVTVGVTDFAQEQLSDLTYVELPDVDDEVAASDEIGVVESVKAASDVYAPVAGVIVEVNRDVQETPEIVNSDPYGAGWLFKIRASDPDDVDSLLDADQYEELLPEAPEE
ncbi:MAG: Glycine cleavage system H protein [Verrucomicrobia bacterium ADurb.Bin345]|nr:MAG: Glycine cleavage system H protein [Verrucomicrobia bacterium ADurb.Bin345]